MLYHFTTFENAKNIKINGLNPKIGELTKKYHKETAIPLVYFCDKKNIHTGWSSLIFHIGNLTGKKKIPLRRSNQKIKDINLAITENDIFKYGAIITTEKILKKSEIDNPLFGLESGDYYSTEKLDSVDLKVYSGIEMYNLIKKDNIEIKPEWSIPEYRSVYEIYQLEIYSKENILKEINLFEDFINTNKNKIKNRI